MCWTKSHMSGLANQKARVRSIYIYKTLFWGKKIKNSHAGPGCFAGSINTHMPLVVFAELCRFLQKANPSQVAAARNVLLSCSTQMVGTRSVKCNCSCRLATFRDKGMWNAPSYPPHQPLKACNFSSKYACDYACWRSLSSVAFHGVKLLNRHQYAQTRYLNNNFWYLRHYRYWWLGKWTA